MEGDSYLRASSGNEFNVYLLPDLEKILADDTPESTVLNQDEADLFEDYDSYVYANYLSVPDGMPSLEQAVKVLRSENGDMTVYQWVIEIQNILQQITPMRKIIWNLCRMGVMLLRIFLEGRKRVTVFILLLQAS